VHDEVVEAVQEWLKTQTKMFHSCVIKNPVDCSAKCTEEKGDYLKK
jgi:hypothetical protein